MLSTMVKGYLIAVVLVVAAWSIGAVMDSWQSSIEGSVAKIEAATAHIDNVLSDQREVTTHDTE